MLPLILSALVLSTDAAPARDPLPPGAMARLGTIHQRAPYYHLVWADGGKTIFGGDPEHTQWKLWDAASGRLRETKMLPAEFRRLNDARWRDGGRLFGWRSVKEKQADKEVEYYHFVEYDGLAGKVVRDWKLDRSANQLGLTFSSATLSPDRRWIVAQENDMDICNDLHVLDFENRRYVKYISTSSNCWVSPRFHFTPDGKRFVMTEYYRDNGTRCWEVGTWKEPFAFANGRVISVAFTKDGEMWMVEGTDDKAMRLARRDSGTSKSLPLDDAFAGAGRPYSVAVTPDDRVVIVSGDKGTVVYDRKAGKARHLLAATSADLLPDDKTVVTDNGLLQRWDLESGKPLYKDRLESGHTDEVQELRFSADGKRLYSAAADGTLRVWDAVAGKPERVFVLGRPRFPRIWYGTTLDGVHRFAVADDAQRLLTMGNGTALHLWDLTSGKEVARLDLPPLPGARAFYAPWGLRISEDGKKVSAVLRECENQVSVGRPLRLDWDVAAKKHTLTPVPMDRMAYPNGAVSADLRYSFQPRHIFDLAAGKFVAEVEGGVPFPQRFSPDGRRVAATETLVQGRKPGDNWQVGVVIFEAPGGETLARVPLEEKQHLRKLAFCPGRGNQVVVAVDAGLRSIDVSTKKVLWRNDWSEQVSEPTAAEVSGRGVVATGHKDGTILLWKLPADEKK